MTDISKKGEDFLLRCLSFLYYRRLVLHGATEKGKKSQCSLLQTAVVVGFNKMSKDFFPD